MSISQAGYYRVALSRVPGVGPLVGRSLIDRFGTAEEVFRTPVRELSKLNGVSERVGQAIKTKSTFEQADAIVAYADRHGIRPLWYAEADYPGRMARYAHAPLLLYLYGQVDLNPAHSLSIIGTREMSAEGRRQTERLVAPLVDYQPLIVSGLAAGVDITAHLAAVRSGIPTLGVLAHGHQHVYPKAHHQIVHRMCENGGVISTYPYWVRPEREYFPARNRLVAMLGDATIVVESARQGGSMITIKMAEKLRKPIGACPGRGGHLHTAGCNELIKSGRAQIICSASDAAELAGWSAQQTIATQAKLFEQLSPDESAIVSHLKQKDSLAADDLRRRLNWSSALLAAQLLAMECKGIIDSLPGQRYRLSGIG